MNILDIAKQRFSVRNYLTKEISQETLETILEAAHVAPTAANMQPVKLLVVKSDEAKEKLAKAANIYSAPFIHFHGSGPPGAAHKSRTFSPGCASRYAAGAMALGS